MTRRKRSPLGYIFIASLLPICLLGVYDEFGIETNSNLKAQIYFCLIFLMLSVLWDIIGMVSLIAAGARGRLAIGVSAILLQLGTYYWLWQALGIKIGELSF